MRPAGVLHVITMLELGGAQRNTLDTVQLLDRGRFRVGLACADRGELLGEARELRDVQLYPIAELCREVRPARDLRSLRALRGVIRAFRPHVVHTHSSKAGILGRAAAAAEGVPVVIHSIHGFGFGPHQPAPVRTAFLAAERWAARRTTHFVAVSRRNLEDGVRMGLFGPEKGTVIRSGIDLSAFRSRGGGDALRGELAIPPQAPLVVQIACFKPQKAPQRFLHLAARLAGTFPDAHFLMIGDGALRGALEAERRGLGLEDRLHLPGWRRDVPAVLDAATVVTLTSRFEGLPRALVEALAAGVPVVATAVDGVDEVVRDGVNGFLVGEGDEAGMAARVAELLADSRLRERLSAAAGADLDEFDRDAMVRGQESLYARLLAGRGIALPATAGGGATEASGG